MRNYAFVAALMAMGNLLNAQVSLLVMPSGPADQHLNSEGDYETWAIPYYSTGRVQYIYERAMLGTFKKIDRFAVRPDGSGSYQALKVDWRMIFGSTGTPVPSKASKTSFAANLGTGATLVMKRKLILLPTSLKPLSPRPFVNTPLDAPFVLDAMAKSMVVDILGFGKTHAKTEYRLDATRTGRSRAAAIAGARPGCGETPGNSWTEYYFSTNKIGAVFNTAMSAPTLKGDSYVWALVWAGPAVTTPINFPPRTSCYINVLPRAIRASVYGGGFLSMDLGSVPGNAKLLGERIHYQFGAITRQGRLLLSRGINLTLNDGRSDHYGRRFSLGKDTTPWDAKSDKIQSSSSYSALIFRVD